MNIIDEILKAMVKVEKKEDHKVVLNDVKPETKARLERMANNAVVCGCPKHAHLAPLVLLAKKAALAVNNEQVALSGIDWFRKECGQASCIAQLILMGTEQYADVPDEATRLKAIDGYVESAVQRLTLVANDEKHPLHEQLKALEQAACEGDKLAFRGIYEDLIGQLDAIPVPESADAHESELLLN